MRKIIRLINCGVPCPFFEHLPNGQCVCDAMHGNIKGDNWTPDGWEIKPEFVDRSFPPWCPLEDEKL